MSTVSNRLKNINNRDVLLILSGVALGTSVASAFAEAMIGNPNWAEWVVGFLQNFSTEMFGGFITFLLIEVLIVTRKEREAREQEFNEKIEEKERQVKEAREALVRQISSRVNSETIRAAEELRYRTWLDDGLLNGQNLSGANLADAHLAGAMLIGTMLHRSNMQGCSLFNANLENAQLVGVDLSEARVRLASFKGAYMQGVNLTGCAITDKQLCVTSRLKGATMPDGNRYDGRFRLAGDIRDAVERDFDPESEDSMAAYYKVDTEMYREGQDWAERHLERLLESVQDEEDA